MLTRAHIVVTGRVQEVCFRAYDMSPTKRAFFLAIAPLPISLHSFDEFFRTWSLLVPSTAKNEYSRVRPWGSRKKGRVNCKLRQTYPHVTNTVFDLTCLIMDTVA